MHLLLFITSIVFLPAPVLIGASASFYHIRSLARTGRCHRPFKLPPLPTVQVAAATHRSSYRCYPPFKSSLRPAVQVTVVTCNGKDAARELHRFSKFFKAESRFQNISKQRTVSKYFKNRD
ncbi:hypothetical protein LJX78_02365 [Methanimicrococcus blatticola]|uniref:hypothetical protein n=1 Tax=Methanimicrococcus blatticola TaxID=91560 RepID=UPI001E48A8E6|nr:hypothetical protein [Methanimicrococcus blatticola]MCC2508454.1 hypothetical protein [Methanimicrococcus blatticola]